MALHSHTALTQAMDLSISDCNRFFASKAFKDYCAERESQGKAQAALFDRINGVIVAIKSLGKALTGRR